jgi:hypothetical protein
VYFGLVAMCSDALRSAGMRSSGGLRANFHGDNTGSNPVGDAKYFNILGLPPMPSGPPRDQVLVRRFTPFPRQDSHSSPLGLSRFSLISPLQPARNIINVVLRAVFDTISARAYLSRWLLNAHAAAGPVSALTFSCGRIYLMWHIKTRHEDADAGSAYGHTCYIPFREIVFDSGRKISTALLCTPLLSEKRRSTPEAAAVAGSRPWEYFIC